MANIKTIDQLPEASAAAVTGSSMLSVLTASGTQKVSKDNLLADEVHKDDILTLEEISASTDSTLLANSVCSAGGIKTINNSLVKVRQMTVYSQQTAASSTESITYDLSTSVTCTKVLGCAVVGSSTLDAPSSNTNFPHVKECTISGTTITITCVNTSSSRTRMAIIICILYV